MSDWADGEGFTTLEDVFTSRDFGRPTPQAAAAVPVFRAAPRPRRTHLVTNRAIAVISASAAALSVLATLVVNGGGPSIAPVISAQHAPPNAPGSLTPVPQSGGGQGATGASSGSGATGTPGAAPGASGAGAGVGTVGGSPAGTGAPSGNSSAGAAVVALGPAPASASLASFTSSHPAHPAPPPPPAPTNTTTTPPAPPVSAGPAATGVRDNGKGNAEQNPGNGNAKGVPNNGGGTVVVAIAAGPSGHAKGKA